MIRKDQGKSSLTSSSATQSRCHLFIEVSNLFKVLFIDNDATLRIITKNSIESHWNCKCLLAANGAEGLKMALKEAPRLIILDIIMPGYDGVATLKKLREQGINTPVIFVTAKEETDELEQYKDLNVISVLQKPFVPRTLLEACKKVLGDQS